MTDATPGWSVTDKAAAILKSYGVDDLAAARAVVALVLDEAARTYEGGHWYLNPDASAAIRALKPKGDT